jgi:hypothetical protein
LALGKRDVHRVGDPMFEVVGFEICGGEHGSGPFKALTYL